MSLENTRVGDLNDKNKVASYNEQPRALTWLFLTELWERFSYWSLYSLLVIYMVHVLDFIDTKSYLLFASFNAILYASPILGGWLADRYLTAHKTVLHGCVWMMLGYLTLALVHSVHGFYLSLALLVWGNGLFKPNISSILGACYHQDDSRRQRGFTIYYMGINIGAIIGTIGCGWVALHISWEVAFLTVAMGMLIGIVTYVVNSDDILQEMIESPVAMPRLGAHVLVSLLGVMLCVPLAVLLSFDNFATVSLLITIVLSCIYMIYIMLKLSWQEQARMLICLILIVASIAFWALYMQMGSSLTLYIQRCVDLHIFSYPIAASSVSSVNGIWLLLLSPMLVKLWSYLSAKQKEPRTHTKFVLGIVLMAGGYTVLALSAWQLVPGIKLNLSWIIGSYGLQTLGELCLSPIGLAMITELAPQQYKSVMLGVWFLATAIASMLSGFLADLASVSHSMSDNIPHLYAHAFGIDAGLALIVALILLCVSPVINRLLEVNNKVAI